MPDKKTHWRWNCCCIADVVEGVSDEFVVVVGVSMAPAVETRHFGVQYRQRDCGGKKPF